MEDHQLPPPAAAPAAPAPPAAAPSPWTPLAAASDAAAVWIAAAPVSSEAPAVDRAPADAVTAAAPVVMLVSCWPPPNSPMMPLDNDCARFCAAMFTKALSTASPSDVMASRKSMVPEASPLMASVKPLVRPSRRVVSSSVVVCWSRAASASSWASDSAAARPTSPGWRAICSRIGRICWSFS